MMYKLLVGACCLLVGVAGQRFRQPSQDVAQDPQLDHLSGLGGHTTTPVPILVDSRRIDLQTGAFVYEYAGGDGSSKYEFRFPNGTVVGNYTFINDRGELETRVYAAGLQSTGIDETLDPNYVDLGDYEHYRHLEQPYVHQDASFSSFPGQSLLRSVQQPRIQQAARPQVVQQARTPPPHRPVVHQQPQQFHRQPVVHQPLPSPPVHHIPRRPAIQVPQLPQVSVPLDFNVQTAVNRHFSQPPIIAPTFDLVPNPLRTHIPAPALPRAPVHHRAPAPTHVRAPFRAPAHAPAPVHVRAPVHVQSHAPFHGNLGQSVIRQRPQLQPQPLPAAPHRLSVAASPSPGQSTSDFLDSVIRKFQ